MPSPWSGALKSGSMPCARSPSSWASEGPAMTTPSSRSQTGTEDSWRTGSASPGNSAIHRSGSASGPAGLAAGGCRREPREAHQHKDAGSYVSRERAHAFSFVETLNVRTSGAAGRSLRIAVRDHPGYRL